MSGPRDAIAGPTNAMDNLKTYEFAADAASLSSAVESGALPERWEGPLRALVSEIAAMTTRKPASIYICSADEDADARNHFAFVLARLLREHAPGVILVDCDFLSVGMSGIVPHRDALGFLDLLLYGTSLGVIAQDAAHGAKVVGAGSFAVTRKNPFAVDAFVAARRYLVNQVKCVFFVGPAGDDEEGVHPIARNVDLVALVRAGDRFDERFLDPLERSIASIEGVDARSVRLNRRVTAPAAAEGRRDAPERRAGEARAVEPAGGASDARAAARAGRFEGEGGAAAAGEAGAGRTRPTAGGPRFDEQQEREARAGRKGRASRAVRVIASVAALSAVVFIVWWLYMTRSVREPAGGKPETAGPPAAAMESQTGDSLRAEAGADVTPAGDAVREATVRRDAPEAAGAGEAAEPARDASAAAPEKLRVFETLGSFAGQYVIHVSSFRGTERASEEGLYLLGRGYPVFMYHVDLGSKGMWYRVYVGPFATRDDAMDTKIKLDENPRITSTRVSKVPG